MLHRFVLTVVFVGVTVAFALGRDVVVDIKKVDGQKVTFAEFKVKGEPAGKDETATAVATVVVEKKGKAAGGKGGKAGKGGKGAPVPNDPVEGGLTNAMFKDIPADKGVRATVTIDDDGPNKDKITKIVVGGGKGGGKKGG